MLGLKRDHIKDSLFVSWGTSSTVTKSLTQRMVLSLVFKAFDPIGLVALFANGARLFLKDTWRVSGKHWVEELPKDTVERFLEWSVELRNLAEINITRSYFSETLNTWNYTCLAVVLKRSSVPSHFSELE